MLNCNDPNHGYFKYECKTCGRKKTIKFSCNSRICSRCGKKFTDRWSHQLAQKLFPISHRHFIFTIPEELWYLLEKDTKLWKILLDTVKITFEKVVKWKRKGSKLTLGIICVLHTYGSDLKFNPHVHAIVTEGCLTKNRNWEKIYYFNYKSMRRVWQYHILVAIKNRYKGNIKISELVNRMFQKYRNGFVIDGKRRISHMKSLAKYIIRYVRHPAIADSRIQAYDGKEVQFSYKTRIDGKIQHHKKTMQVNDFIGALLNFIPPKNFKVIRYYGLYSRRSKIDLRNLLDQLVKCYGDLSIYNYDNSTKKLKGNKIKTTIICPFCGNKMKLVEIYWPSDHG